MLSEFELEINFYFILHMKYLNKIKYLNFINMLNFYLFSKKIVKCGQRDCVL